MKTIRTTNYKSYISVNGVLQSRSSLFDSLRRFVTPVYFYVEAEFGSHISALGSSLYICRSGRFFRITCRHIAENNNFDHAMNAINWQEDSGEWRLSTTDRIFGVGSTEDEVTIPNEDFVIAEFCDLSASARKLFLPVSDNFFLTPAEHPTFNYCDMFLVGYPCEYVSAKWDEVGAECYSKLSAWVLDKHYCCELEPVANSVWDGDGSVVLQAMNGFGEVAPDGLSGSPVFVVMVANDGQHSLGLLGIVSAANTMGRLNVLPAWPIKKRLLDILSEGD